MQGKINDLVASIMGELKEIASTETIVGKPVVFGNKSVVPVSRIMLGFGVGGGENIKSEDPSGKDSGSNFGGGGGGGVRVEPVGFILISDDKVSFLPTAKGKWDGIIEAIPDILSKFRPSKEEKDKKEKSKE
jgi:uncharacterized spore protein YtfJ